MSKKIERVQMIYQMGTIMAPSTVYEFVSTTSTTEKLSNYTSVSDAKKVFTHKCAPYMQNLLQ